MVWDGIPVSVLCSHVTILNCDTWHVASIIMLPVLYNTIYIGRMIKGTDWQSLSIPKGASKAFNTEKFSQDRKRQHFTDEFLKDNKK